MLDVVGLGTLAMDVFLRVDNLPKEDGFCVVEETSYLPGGSGTNVIVQLSRLNAKCSYIGKIGNDKLGNDVLSNLKNEGISLAGMVTAPGGTTLHTNVVVDHVGSKFIMLNMGDVFMTLRDNEVNYDIIRGAKVFYTDMFPFQAALSGLIAAKKAGVYTVFNMQTGFATMENCGVSKEMFLDALQYVDLFSPCRDGLCDITGTDDLVNSFSYIRKYFSGLFLVTLGSKGSVAFDEKDNMFEMPSRRIKPMDTTGAGDSYIGSFIYRYCIKGFSLKNSMNFATACAAYTCTGLGARNSPTLEQAERFILEA